MHSVEINMHAIQYYDVPSWTTEEMVDFIYLAASSTWHREIHTLHSASLEV